MGLTGDHVAGSSTGHTSDHNLIDVQVTTTLPALMDSKDAAASVLDRARTNHTGTQTLATISDAGTAAGYSASAFQAADADLTTIAALDSATAGALVTDGSGWIRKTYAQLKTALALGKGDVGLGSVDNTADTAKPVSTAQQTALDLKANLASPALTGSPTAPTQSAADNSTKIATTAYADAKVSKTVWTAKGSILAATAASTPADLPVGSNGQVLTADSTVSNGVKWATATSSSTPVGRALGNSVTYGSVPGAASVTLSGTQTQSANRIVYEPWIVQSSITLDRLAIEVTTAVASSNARLAIYNADTSWQPTTLVLDAGAVATATTGIKTITISQTLSAGRYLVALNVDSAGIVLRNVNALHEATGVDISGSNFQNTTFWYVGSTYGAFASTGVAWTAVATSTNPGFVHSVVARVSTP